ncbi:MAG: hypothetical protein ABIG44_18880 [Planctomycetota bacterium]
MSCFNMLLAQTTQSAASLTVSGAIIMFLSVALVLGLCIFCFWRILREPALPQNSSVSDDGVSDNGF